MNTALNDDLIYEILSAVEELPVQASVLDMKLCRRNTDQFFYLGKSTFA